MTTAMDNLLSDLIDSLRATGELDAHATERIIARHNRLARAPKRAFSKKMLLPRLEQMRAEQGALWLAWNITEEEWEALSAALRVKPRRTASGVATVTVITKPWSCQGGCLFCPTAEGMPKSYLPDEPACQRAARCDFDPYEQVTARIATLEAMGHPTDKVELIVLGGTFADYPRDYQEQFIAELFRGLNEAGSDALTSSGATLEELHRINETSSHRNVGLVVETRPDTITPEFLTRMRRLGCTKVQIGVQSIDEDILARNARPVTRATIQHAFELLRAFGFKSHAHFMANLLGATPEGDKRDYLEFVTSPAFSPDEVKLYPCALIAGTGLEREYQQGAWQPYTEEELIEVLATDTAATPPWTRISRMIRDFSSDDIIAGNKKPNLRQRVDAELAKRGTDVQEIRSREIGTDSPDLASLNIDTLRYRTTNTEEAFLQWVTPQGRIAGFLRLSLPNQTYVQRLGDALPIELGQAMIREVHVYGAAARLGASSGSAQHTGLGTQLIEAACKIAREAGYTSVNVISAVGTREYYRRRGFADAGMYQRREL